MNPKERILEASAKLFSEKGFSAVGVREIASEANVNISMISYYFNGKNGIMIELLKEYFNELHNIINEVKTKNLSQEESLKELIKSIIIYLRNKHHKCKAAINEMPLMIPEIYQIKLKLFEDLINSIRTNFSSAKFQSNRSVLDSVIGSAFVSLLFSNFLFGDMMKNIYNIEYDDEYFEEYSTIISTLFISGIRGVSDYLKQKANN